MIGFFSRVWDVAREEVRTLPKRPWEWITGLLLPVFWLIFVANSFGPGLMRHLPVGLVNIDGGRLSHALIMSRDASDSRTLHA